jgi:hypothetical protein
LCIYIEVIGAGTKTLRYGFGSVDELRIRTTCDTAMRGGGEVLGCCGAGGNTTVGSSGLVLESVLRDSC